MILLISLLLLNAEPNPAAVRLTRKATVAYNAGEFGQAFLDYQAAYDLEPIPELLFDMGQCQRMLRHPERASFLYKRYLTAKPQARNRAKVEELLAQLEQKVAEATAAAPPPGDVPQAAPPEKPGEVVPAAPTDRPAEVAAEPAPASVAVVRPVASAGIPLPVAILGGAGAVALLGAGGLGLAVLLQPDTATQLPDGQLEHSLKYTQLVAINTEGSVAAGLAIGGAIAVTAALLWWAVYP